MPGKRKIAKASLPCLGHFFCFVIFGPAKKMKAPLAGEGYINNLN